MFLLSSLFIFLGMGAVQPVADVPVQVTEHVSSTQYQFEYQQNKHIIDLNAERKILAYYINNELQNPSLLPSTQRELLQYDQKSNLDLLKTFDVKQSSSPHSQRMKTRLIKASLNLLQKSLPRSQGMTTVGSAPYISIQIIEYLSATRYQFKYQENEHIIDLSAKQKVLAYYINNELQNPSLLPSTQKELLQYDEKSKSDLWKTFNHSPKRTRRRTAARDRAIARIRARNGKQQGTRGRIICSSSRCRPTRQRIRVERPSTKINLSVFSENLLDVGSTFTETGVPHIVAFGTAMMVLGFFLSWFD